MGLVLALILAIMVFAVNVPTFAATGDPITATTGTITVQNAAKGETYKIYKIFDATISKVEGSDGIPQSSLISTHYLNSPWPAKIPACLS